MPVNILSLWIKALAFICIVIHNIMSFDNILEFTFCVETLWKKNGLIKTRTRVSDFKLNRIVNNPWLTMIILYIIFYFIKKFVIIFHFILWATFTVQPVYTSVHERHPPDVYGCRSWTTCSVSDFTSRFTMS